MDSWIIHEYIFVKGSLLVVQIRPHTVLLVVWKT